MSRLRLRQKLPAAIERLRPDILFLPGNFHLVLARCARGAAKPPVVVAKVSNPIAPVTIPPVRWLIERLYRWAAIDVDVLVAMSAGLADDVRRLTGGCMTRVIHDPNILPSAPLAPLASKTDVLRIVAAGRLVPQKDFALTIRVAAEIARVRPVALTIWGEGAQRRRLQHLAHALGIANSVSLPGHIPSIAPALAYADLLLVTSRYEGGPAVAVEALNAGVPVIATDCSHFLRDIIRHPDHGRIVRSRRPDKIATDIAEWLDRPDRKPFCGRSATAAMDAGEAARRYLELFDELATRDRPTGQPWASNALVHE